MQRTRTLVTLLAGLALATLSGCVSVQPQPAAPPRPETGRPAHQLAPQTAGPPVHDTLEAVPKAKRSSAAAAPSAAHLPAAPPAARPAGPRLPQGGPAPVRPRPRLTVPAAPAPALPAPGGGSGVCALGRGYGHWPAGSPQSRICDRAYGR
ncbi:hypothetical protein [Streptomyces sp. NBC_00525]|uniref:hypothetical protein n=1 Tax=Streptomyces sp. NBC_00525 TaxID=2903660 RepID=UPI002E813A50|nr:hypothetical protein [Streptomyces sp. NBC_00525]